MTTCELVSSYVAGCTKKMIREVERYLQVQLFLFSAHMLLKIDLRAEALASPWYYIDSGRGTSQPILDILWSLPAQTSLCCSSRVKMHLSIWMHTIDFVISSFNTIFQGARLVHDVRWQVQT